MFFSHYYAQTKFVCVFVDTDTLVATRQCQLASTKLFANSTNSPRAVSSTTPRSLKLRYRITVGGLCFVYGAAGGACTVSGAGGISEVLHKSSGMRVE